MEEKLESMEEKTEDLEKKLASANENLEGTKEKSESVEEKPKDMEEKSENVEEGLEEKTESERAGETADEKDNKSKEEREKRNKKIIAGSIELTVAIILIALSAWLFSNTRGTRLLYVSVTTGRVSRYYWVFLAIAVILAVLGLITLKSSRKRNMNRRCADE